MTISELIAELETMKARYGDLDVVVMDDWGQHVPPSYPWFESDHNHIRLD